MHFFVVDQWAVCFHFNLIYACTPVCLFVHGLSRSSDWITVLSETQKYVWTAITWYTNLCYPIMCYSVGQESLKPVASMHYVLLSLQSQYWLYFGWWGLQMETHCCKVNSGRQLNHREAHSPPSGWGRESEEHKSENSWLKIKTV